MLAHALVLDGINARSMPAGAVSAEHISRLDLAGVQGVCLSYFSPTPEAHLRYVARRLRRRQPGLQIVAALWNAPPALLAPGAAAELGVDAVVHTVIEASQCLLSRLGMASAELSPAPPATQSPAPADRAEADGVEALSMPLPAAMAQTAQRLADVFDASAAMVSLIDQTCQVWQAGKHPGRSGPSGTAQAPHLEILMEWSLGQSQPQAVCDIARDPRLAQQAALQQAGVRFVATTPLRTSAGEMVGALCVMDSEPRQLSEREIHLLETVADELMRNVPAHDPGSTDALAPPELAALAQTRGLQVAPT